MAYGDLPLDAPEKFNKGLESQATSWQGVEAKK
jgi:hypothetical protein